MITIKFLGQYKEKAGTDNLLLKEAQYPTLKKVLDALPGMFPALDLTNANIALNQQIVTETALPLKDGDEVAVFPLVSGG